jgi:poly(hydroxyalkanoate) depolymerase family esterase
MRSLTRPRALAVVAALGVAITASAATAASAPDNAAGGSFTEQHFSSTAGDRDYWVYQPPGPKRANRPMVVFLHGCNETATDAAAATHFNDLAAQRGFIVVYPQQNVTAGSSAPLVDGNGVGCWNWFLPQDQERGSGEPAVLVGITQLVAKQLRVDPRRIYVEGVSAGADMAVTLGATYPDVFAAVGVLAGCAYRTCGDATGELSYHAMGSNARVVPMFIENGTADTLNNFAMAGELLSSWLGVDDLADDGAMNGSMSRQPASTDNYGLDQTPQPLSGDACIHNNTLTCPGGVIGFQQTYPYTVAKYDNAGGCDVLEFWAVHFMEHAHPDAPGDGPYTDPLGPDVTAASYDFFSNHSIGEQECSR